jgi:phosphotransferase family enzyme
VESLRLACSLDAPPALGLDAIDELTDSATGLALIKGAIGGPGGRYEGFRAIAVEPAVVRLKPANRATVRLALRLPPNSPSEWPTTIYAKVYKGKKGVVAWRGMTALRDAEAGAGGFFLAEPLAWLDDKRVLLQGAVVGDRDLKNVLRAGVRSGEAGARLELDQTMRKVGHALAGIHRCGATAGAAVHWQDELTERREEVGELSPLLEGAGIVEPAREAVRFLDGLASLDARYPPDRSVPAHGSFRPGQVLLGGGEVALIDWDGYCQAEPARDVGLRDRGSEPGHRRRGPERRGGGGSAGGGVPGCLSGAGGGVGGEGRTMGGARGLRQGAELLDEGEAYPSALRAPRARSAPQARTRCLRLRAWGTETGSGTDQHG